MINLDINLFDVARGQWSELRGSEFNWMNPEGKKNITQVGQLNKVENLNLKGLTNKQP